MMAEQLLPYGLGQGPGGAGQGGSKGGDEVLLQVSCWLLSLCCKIAGPSRCP
jgi:hypothetical protein